MKTNTLNYSLETLEIDSTIITKLNTHNIYKVNDLWNLTRKKLRELGLNDSEIKHLTIKLQLHGIDFNKKIYNRN